MKTVNQRQFDLQSILIVKRTEVGFETEEIRELSFVPLIPAEV